MSTTPKIADLIVETPGTCSGRPRMAGRRFTVENIAPWHERRGQEAGVICSEHNETTGQVRGAPTYHLEGREAIDQGIGEGDAMVESLRPKTAC